MSSPHRVVVTGIGPICAIGIGREDFSSGLFAGREGRRAPERLQGEWPNLPLIAECLDFVVEDYLETEKTYLDRCSELVLASCALLLEKAALPWRRAGSKPWAARACQSGTSTNGTRSSTELAIAAQSESRRSWWRR